MVLHEFVLLLNDCFFCMIGDNCKEMEGGGLGRGQQSTAATSQ